MDTVYLTDITATLGAWFDADIDDEVPSEVMDLLQKAYNLAAEALNKR